MTKRSRWQPPHPAPPRVRRELWRPGIELCIWPGCERPAVAAVMPICDEHAFRVHDEVEAGLLAVQNARRLNRQAEADARRSRQEQAVRDSKGDAPGWIYYLRIDDKVKIGYTGDITQRMRAYPPGTTVLAVHPGTPRMERELHRQFAAHLVQGREWFRPATEILDHCAAVVAEHGDPSRYRYQARDPLTQTIRPKGWSGA